MIHVANPIYDSVFKYLMEDDRIAKIIISALIKEDVVNVEMRPHEYSNQTRDKLSMFRIDFAATVRDQSGEERIVLIELQKTWLPTETLRFRQYLGAQYGSKRNIVEDSAQGFAYPMVAVYLLGHRVGDIEEPIVYVNHNVYDYDGRPVTKGVPDPFIESVHHNCIIVQIPRLHVQINNKLEKILSVFDQSRAEEGNTQLIDIDEKAFADDTDMMFLINRLTAAAADAEVRQDMNVEDEYFSEIERRDTDLMQQRQKLEKANAQITEQKEQISEQKAQIASLAKALRDAGSSIEAIAKATGISAEQLKDILDK